MRGACLGSEIFAAPEGGAQKGGSEHGGGGGQAGCNQLADGRVHVGIGRQAARLAAQLSKHVAACAQHHRDGMSAL